jgi:hypothetical protein
MPQARGLLTYWHPAIRRDYILCSIMSQVRGLLTYLASRHSA